MSPDSALVPAAVERLFDPVPVGHRVREALGLHGQVILHGRETGQDEQDEQDKHSGLAGRGPRGADLGDRGGEIAACSGFEAGV